MSEEEFYLIDLKSKFDKIKPNTYYLSYSGGKDSHFLYWFIKEYLKRDDIKIVGINTYMEHHEILKRIIENSDIVLLPKMKPMEIKEKYGIPCFSKMQDEYISRYQKGVRTDNTMKAVLGQNTVFKLSKKARNLLLSDKLHKISNKCCKVIKKDTFHAYEKQSGRKAILGIRSSESSLRKQQYKSCFTKDKKFTPIHDLSDELLEKIIKKYNIEVPKVYNYISRTGCSGCCYGSWKGATKKELLLITDNQFNFVCDYFKESYDVLGIPVETISTLRNQIKNNEITLEEAITIISTCKY